MGAKIEKIEDIAASLPEWDFLKQLPENVGFFVKVPGRGIEGQILSILSYVDEEHHRRLDLIYTKETFDYIPVKMVGLHMYRDERFFCRDKDRFAQLIKDNLPMLLEEISHDRVGSYSYEARRLNFAGWDFWKKLPKRIGPFELFITPDKPVQYINGSIIFLDYSDFEHQSQLYFMFNSFRIEVFGEMLQRNVPVTTNAFTVPTEDAQGCRNEISPVNILPQFSQLLEKYLQEHLDKLQREEFQTI